MANKKISELSEVTSLENDDVLPLVRDIDNFKIKGSNLPMLPVGGTTNQVLFKLSNTDRDAGWASFSNGITYDGGFKLGGNLIGDTSISIGSNNISFPGTGYFGIGTSTPGSALDVGGRNSAFNSSQIPALDESWLSSLSIPEIRAYCSTVIANGYVYVIGGYLDGFNPKDTVYYSKINADGSLSGWSTTTSLPSAKGAQTASVANGYIYVTGGNSASTYYSRINSDGTLGTWITGTAYPTQSEYLASAVANGYLYVAGGLHSNATQLTNVYYTNLNADGSIGAWTAATSLPNARQGPSLVVANGYLYVIGGYGSEGSGGAQSTVYYASLNTDGSIGSWSSTSSLNVALADSAAIVADGGIYVVFGATGFGSSFFQNVLFARINANGTLGSWNYSGGGSSGGTDLGAHGSVYYNGFIYVIGGQRTAGVLDSVYYIQTPKVKICGVLDMLSISGGKSTMGVGNAGSAIYAGNIYSDNNLEIAGSTQLFGGLSVNGPISLKGNIDINGAVSLKPMSAPAVSPADTAVLYLDSTDNSLKVSSDGGNYKNIVVGESSTKTTGGAPYTNDGYITVNIGGTDVKLMTTA